MTTLRSYLQRRTQRTHRVQPVETFNTPRKVNRSEMKGSQSVYKKISLPPILESAQHPNHQLFSLQLKRSQALSHFFKQKGRQLVSNQSVCLKTEPSQRTSRSPPSRFTVNLSETRMRPLEKYFHRMENIRLAERLLVVKPSQEMDRSRLKKCYRQQQHYGAQISRNPNVLKSSRRHKKKVAQRMVQLQKHWQN